MLYMKKESMKLSKDCTLSDFRNITIVVYVLLDQCMYDVVNSYASVFNIWWYMVIYFFVINTMAGD